MSDSILNNYPSNTVGMGKGQSESDRSAKVLHEQDIVSEPQRVRQLTDRFCEMIECVGIFRRLRCAAVAEAGIIRGNEMVAICEQRDQRIEHPRRGRKPVQHHKSSGRLSDPPHDKRC